MTTRETMEQNREEMRLAKIKYIDECEQAYQSGVYECEDHLTMNQPKLLEVFRVFREMKLDKAGQLKYLQDNAYDIEKMRILYHECIRSIRDLFEKRYGSGAWTPFYFLGGDDGHNDAFKYIITTFVDPLDPDFVEYALDMLIANNTNPIEEYNVFD